MTQVCGRFAPSPTGSLHLGNLRTALIAWLSARDQAGSFILRCEDLDRVTSSPRWTIEQQADLSAIGIDWDGPVVNQSERFDRYNQAIDQLADHGRVYPCFCSRRDVAAAVSAPHGSPGRYPGTCKTLTTLQRIERQRQGRPPALRLDSHNLPVEFVDRCAGHQVGLADDVVVRRNDGVPAYNLAVVVDDAAQGVSEVVRGDDLLPSTATQIVIGSLLDLPIPTFVHVPLAVSRTGERLAKRHGSVTLADLATSGHTPVDVLRTLAISMGIDNPQAVSAADLLHHFDLGTIPRHPWIPDLSDD